MKGIFFIKKCVRSFIEVVIIVDYVSAYICICICMRLYNKGAYKNFVAALLFVDFSKSLVSIHRGKVGQILVA